MTETSAGPLSFEEAFHRLEETVKALEASNLSLEQALALYEEGVQLVRLCNQFLDNAELKVSQLHAGEQMKLPNT